MNLLYLKYFHTLATCKNMTEAAEKLYISQPSLSKAIRKLSEELGYPLFTTVNRRLVLTESGKVLLSYSEEILDTLDDTFRQLEQQRQEMPEYVHIDTRISLSFMNQANLSFSQIYPHIKYVIYNHQQIAPRPQKYDLVISSRIGNNEENSPEILFQEEMFLAIPENHALSSRPCFSLKDLKDQEFLRLTPNHHLQLQLDHWLSERGFSPNYILDIDDYRSMFAMVEAGIGIAFVPGVSWGSSEHYAIRLLRMEKENMTRLITIESPSNEKLSAAAKLYRDYIRRYFSDKHLPDFQ